MKVKFYLNEAQKNSVWVLFFEHKNLFLRETNPGFVSPEKQKNPTHNSPYPDFKPWECFFF